MAGTTLARDYDIARMLADYERRIAFLERQALRAPASMSPEGQPYDTGWLDTGVVWAGNWEDYQPDASQDHHFEYRRIGFMVGLRGLARRTAGASANQTLTILTMPTGFRPTRANIRTCLTSGGVETGAASAGTAHTHPVGSQNTARTTGAQMRVQVASNGIVNVGIGVGQSFAADNWVSMSEIWYLVG